MPPLLRSVLSAATFLALAACQAVAGSSPPAAEEMHASDVRAAGDGCFVFGTHHQICGEEAFDLGGRDVEALPFYACLRDATCAKGTAGRCSWQTTPAIDECLRTSEPPPGRTPHADFHVHWDQPEKATPGIYSPYESLAHIDAMGITAGMLITNTYNAHRTPAMTAGELVDINRRYSEILGTHPHASRYQILCGVSFQRADAPDVAKGCLELPRVRGIKLRNFTLRRAEDLARFEALVATAHEHGSLVLAHLGWAEEDFAEDAAASERRMADTRNLVAVMERYPRATLVIAHSGFQSFVGWSEYAWIGAHYRENPGTHRNIYLETSDSITDFEDGAFRPDTEGWVRSWRDFGLDHVLFGSDFAYLIPFVDAPLRFLTTTDLLTPAESAAIVRGTGERLAIPAR